MALYGLTATPPRYCSNLRTHDRGSVCKQVSFVAGIGNSAKLPRLESNSCHRLFQRCLIRRKPLLVMCTMDISFGDTSSDSTAVFPRINVKDPYKRLGISTEASEDEIQGARNFLIQKFGGHSASLDAIESAHDKIIMKKFYDRKNPKFDIKKKVKAVSQSRVVQFVTSRFQTPSTNFIVKTLVAFVILGALTVLFPTEEGPTLQVAISLIAAVYFIHDRLKSKLRTFLYGTGAFIFSWLVGTFLMVSVIPPILKGPRSLEVTTSLITYVLLWVSSTYLK